MGHVELEQSIYYSCCISIEHDMHVTNIHVDCRGMQRRASRASHLLVY